MNATQFTKTATGVIASAGTTAHQVIDAYQSGATRLNEFATDRWNSALKQSAPQLTAETRKNAAHLQKVCSGIYVKGVDLSVSGAKVVEVVHGSAADKAGKLAKKGGADADTVRMIKEQILGISKRSTPATDQAGA